MRDVRFRRDNLPYVAGDAARVEDDRAAHLVANGVAEYRDGTIVLQSVVSPTRTTAIDPVKPGRRKSPR